MKPPRSAEDHPDRLADLEEKLEPFVYAYMSARVQAGYDYREIKLAVMHLALNSTRQLGTEAKADAAAMRRAVTPHTASGTRRSTRPS